MTKNRKVRPEEQFLFVNGATADSLSQLRSQLKRLRPDEFSHHVNGEKNDVYTWLRDCVDSSLAERIRDVRDQGRMVDMLK